MNERILIVDDSRDTADSLAKLITAFGYEAKAVYDGRQAIEEARDFLPDMALIDIGMPGFDGYETVTQLRQQRDSGQVILVAVTGWSRDEDKQRAYAAGFDLHVTKPMSVEKLQELLGLLDPESPVGYAAARSPVSPAGSACRSSAGTKRAWQCGQRQKGHCSIFAGRAAVSQCR